VGDSVKFDPLLPRQLFVLRPSPLPIMSSQSLAIRLCSSFTLLSLLPLTVLLVLLSLFQRPPKFKLNPYFVLALTLGPFMAFSALFTLIDVVNDNDNDAVQALSGLFHLLATTSGTSGAWYAEVAADRQFYSLVMSNPSPSSRCSSLDLHVVRKSSSRFLSTQYRLLADSSSSNLPRSSKTLESVYNRVSILYLAMYVTILGWTASYWS
jgi:hypothetical protein